MSLVVFPKKVVLQQTIVLESK